MPFAQATERALRWLRALGRTRLRWSAASDRQFHDALFTAQTHDAFNPSFAGYLTIRRFADRADEFLRGAAAVLDLGCGPAEITCELARRHPGVRFHGVDHSAAAIERAAANAQRFALANATFEVADVSTYTPPAPVDLITMFDAFHHLLDPAAFVARLSAYTPRFLLIEPAGSALGGWRRTLDFDWVASDLDKIRARIEYETGAAAASATHASQEPPRHGGEAIENRYPLADYERFFDGYALDVAGTVAGLDVYPPDPYAESPMRADVMDIAYQLLTAIDRGLYERGYDLHAKHWILHASREPDAAPRESRRPALGRVPPSKAWRVAGPWDARYTDVRLPREMAANADVLIELTVHNDSWRAWDSRHATAPIHLSYHWVGNRGASVSYDGARSPMPRPLGPGESLPAAMTVRTPAAAGRYVLQIDLVEEGVTWFSRAGTPPFSATVTIA